MAEISIAAEERNEFGKGAARRLRRDRKVPAVLYGHEADVTHLSLPGHELTQALRTPNVLLSLELAGGSQLALPKAIQRHPVRRDIEHVDLVIVRRGEKVMVEIPVHTTGATLGGGVIDVVVTALPVEAEATHIPAEIVIDVDKAEAGFHVNAGDIDLPEGVSLVLEPDTLVVHVIAPQAEEAAEPAAEEAVGEVPEVGEEEAEEAAETTDES